MVIDYVWLQIGIEEIDAQHRELFALISRLIDALSANNGEGEIEEVFDFLEAYGRLHFALEERYMAEAQYPEADAHTAAHAYFVESFRELRERQQLEGDAAMAAVNACNQLGEWLVGHIAQMDRKLGEFLRAD